MNNESLACCKDSDRTINEHLDSESPYQYKCKNGLWDIGMPIIIAGQHLATMFLGQFFYEDEIPDRQFFISQTEKYGFDKKDFLSAMDKVRAFRRDKVQSILEYDMALIDYIVDLAEKSLEQREEKAERKKLESQLQQVQKMDSIGRLVGGIAHDYNNMLGVIIGYSELILKDLNREDPVYNKVEQIYDVSNRSLNLNNKLMAFARKQTISPRIIDLNSTIGTTIEMLKSMIGEEINLIWKPGIDLWFINIDQTQMDQILTNLCINARDAISGIGIIQIGTDNIVIYESCSTDLNEIPPGEYVTLSVSDNGCGMSQEILTKLYEPFFTTKETGKGTGLGLSMVYGAVKQNGGFIKVESEEGRGSTFIIYFSRETSETVSVNEQEAETETESGQGIILLVEDEPVLLEMATLLLERMGYHVLNADSPERAIDIAKDQKGRINLLMTDVIMPGMSGMDLAVEINQLYPDIKLLFMSGYTADIISENGVLDKKINFIQKPFVFNDLSRKIREVLDH